MDRQGRKICLAVIKYKDNSFWYLCLECEAEFVSASSYENHVKMQHATDSAVVQQVVQQVQQSVHPNSSGPARNTQPRGESQGQSQTFKCKRCAAVLPSYISFQKHKELHKNSDQQVNLRESEINLSVLTVKEKSASKKSQPKKKNENEGGLFSFLSGNN